MTRPRTLQRWHERLRRFHASALNAAEFCKAEKVSISAFYKWKKRLAQSTLDEPDPQPLTELQFLPLGPLATPNSESEAAECEPLTTRTTVELPGGIRLCIETPATSKQQETAQ